MLLHSIGLKRKPDRRESKPVTGILMTVGGVNYKLSRMLKELHNEVYTLVKDPLSRGPGF